MLFDKIRKLSEQRGENLKTVSKKLGLSENAIYKWKTQSPNIENVMKVAEYFNVSLDYLTGFQEEVNELEKHMTAEDLLLKFEKANFEVEHTNDNGIETVYINHFDHGTVKIMNYYDFLEHGLSLLKELKQKYHQDDDEIQTIAAHHDGEEWTDEELDEIERFKEFVRMKRKQQE